jgi:hypothetical protein
LQKENELEIKLKKIMKKTLSLKQIPENLNCNDSMFFQRRAVDGSAGALSCFLLALALTIPSGLAHAQQTTVDLGAAAGFGVLAGTTVTSTGNTVVNGDLGVSPGTAVTGFGPGVVNGTIHAGDGSAAAAEAALTTAYNDAAGRTVGSISEAGNLGGMTLTPGLYTSSSSLAISSGNLTLDALGDANAVFIFQMASTLTTTSGLGVILAGGANPANIFWQVGSSATLGTTSSFEGNILAFTSITLATGATLNGRALAIGGAVSLDSNNVNVTSVPEPQSLMLSALGFGLLAWRFRRKQTA